MSDNPKPPDFQGPLQIEIESVQAPGGAFCEVTLAGIAVLKMPPDDLIRLGERFTFAGLCARRGLEGFAVAVPGESAEQKES